MWLKLYLIEQYLIFSIANTSPVKESNLRTGDLVNRARKLTPALLKQRKKLLKPFRAFVQLVVPNKSLESLKKEDISIDLVGYFGDYLIKQHKAIKKPGPALNYISALKKYLTQTYNTTIFRDFPEEYSSLRKNLRKEYEMLNGEAGIASEDHAAAVGGEHISFMNSLLLDMSYGTSYSNRVRFGNVHLLNMDHDLIGRISEVRNLKFKQYVYVKETKHFKVCFF